MLVFSSDDKFVWTDFDNTWETIDSKKDLHLQACKYKLAKRSLNWRLNVYLLA